MAGFPNSGLLRPLTTYIKWSRKVKNIEGADRESLKLEFYALFWTATMILGKITYFL